MKISDMDTYFKQKTALAGENIEWFDTFDGAFRINGTCMPTTTPPFCRMAPDCLEKMSQDVRYLAYNTSGIRLRFKTDSKFIALKAKLSSPNDRSHMPRTGSSGFDIYCGAGRNSSFIQIFIKVLRYT
jgi:hypothetical protein